MNYRDYIFLEDHCMDKDGIHAYYTFRGEQRSLLATPPKTAAKLLLKNDMIEDYVGAGYDIEVTWKHSFKRVDYNNELIEEEMKVDASWETFIKEFTLTTEDVVSIIALEEAEREANKEAGVFDKIRDGITKIVSTVFL